MSGDVRDGHVGDGGAKGEYNGEYSGAYWTKGDAMTQAEISDDDASDKWKVRVEEED